MKNLNINIALYVLIIGLFLALSNTAQAATYTVTKTADTNDTVCDADCSLREAFDVADGNGQTDTINFNIPSSDAGCSGANCTITLTSAIEPAADGGNLTTVTGTGANVITLSGGNATKHFTFQANRNVSINFLTISGGNGVSPTLTNCGGAICVATASLTLDNVVLQNNSTPGDGGAINANAASTLSVTNSTIRNNSAGNLGGGIQSANAGSVLNLTNSTVSSNSATNSGGGVYVFSNTTTVTNTSFSNNTAAFGAGFYSERSSATITDSTISNNTAATEGGGLSNNTNTSGGSLTVNNSVINNNRANAGSGGGFSTFGLGTLTINNSTISGNFSNNVGGGIVIFSTANVINSTVSGNSSVSTGGAISNQTAGVLNLTNSTISGNSSTAPTGAAGIRNIGTANLISSTISNNSSNINSGISNSGTATLENTIVANNPGGDCTRLAGTINATYSLIEQNPACVNGTNTNNLTGDPNLGPLANNGGATQTHALQTASIAIDKGNSVLTTDQRGLPRPVDEPTAPNGTGNLSDIGAFEVQGAATGGVSQSYIVNSVNDPGNGTCDAAECTLREAITAANANIGGFDFISFDPSLTGQTITLTSGQLPITDVSGRLDIVGLGANQLTVSGNNASRVYNVNGGSAALIANLSITNGNTDFGGGIRNLGSLVVDSLAIRGNTASNGGGGIRVDPGSSTVVVRSTISGNSSAGTGGGIDSNGSASVSVTNSTISGNTAAGSGGGIVNTGTLTMDSSTISNNSSPFAAGFRNFTGTSNLNNTIIANSISGGDCVRDAGTINATYNLIEGGLTCINGTNSDNLTGDPNLGTLANNGGTTFTHALLAGSIAIDKGNSALTTDQRGSARPFDDPNTPNFNGFSQFSDKSNVPNLIGNLADIGAFEVQAPTAANVSVSGRVMTENGTGLRNAIVILTYSNGQTRTAHTGTFGYYRFDDIAAGQTIVVSVISKRFTFTPQVVNITDNINELNFVAEYSN